MKKNTKQRQTEEHRGAQRTKRIKTSILVMFTTMSLCILTVAAANPFGDFSDDFQSIYNIAKAILLPCAALAVVYGGLCFFGIDLLSQKSTEKQVEKGKLVIRYACVCVAMFYLLPAVINISVNTFSGNAWKPNVPNGGGSSTFTSSSGGIFGGSSGKFGCTHDWIDLEEAKASGAITVIFMGDEDLSTPVCTCTDYSYKGYVCTKCHEIKKESVRPTGHDWKTTETLIAATCTTGGCVNRECNTCGAKETQAAVPSLGHLFNPQGICLRCKFDKNNPTQ